MERSDVKNAMAALAQRPDDKGVQSRVTDVLESAAKECLGEPPSIKDGLKIMPEVTRGAAPGNDRIVTLKGCRNVQEGNRNVQRNRVRRVFTTRRDLASLIAQDPRIARAFVRVAADPRNAGAKRQLSAGLGRAAEQGLHKDVGGVAMAKRVYVPGSAGRSLTIRGGAGISVGRNAVQRNSYALKMRQDRGVMREIKAAVAARERTPSPTSLDGS